MNKRERGRSTEADRKSEHEVKTSKGTQQDRFRMTREERDCSRDRAQE